MPSKPLTRSALALALLTVTAAWLVPDAHAQPRPRPRKERAHPDPKQPGYGWKHTNPKGVFQGSWGQNGGTQLRIERFHMYWDGKHLQRVSVLKRGNEWLLVGKEHHKMDGERLRGIVARPWSGDRWQFGRSRPAPNLHMLTSLNTDEITYFAYTRTAQAAPTPRPREVRPVEQPHKPQPTPERRPFPTKNKPATGGVVLFEHADFQGRRATFGPGAYDIGEIGRALGNDQLSSVRVPAGYRVVLFEHAGFQGRRVSVDRTTRFLANFNDEVSSIKVQRVPVRQNPPPQRVNKKKRKKRKKKRRAFRR